MMSNTVLYNSNLVLFLLHLGDVGAMQYVSPISAPNFFQAVVADSPAEWLRNFAVKHFRYDLLAEDCRSIFGEAMPQADVERLARELVPVPVDSAVNAYLDATGGGVASHITLRHWIAEFRDVVL